jgi:hypothetical protein
MIDAAGAMSTQNQTLFTRDGKYMTKPYAWVDGNSRLQSKQIDPLVDIPLYKKPQWQGLTDDGK